MVFISPRTVSLGVDTFAGDPTSGFALHSDDYLRMGERLAAVGLPTVRCLRAATRWTRWTRWA